MENINIDKIINKWFEMKYQTYDKLEHDGSIYLYYDGDEYAEIRIDKESKYIDYQWKLHDEFSGIIPLQRFEFEKFMSKWVGDTFGLKGFTPIPLHWSANWSLEIPKIDN